MKTALYDKTGSQVGTVDLADGVFARPWNADLLHQVIVSYQANMRAGTAHAQDRSEVRGGGKKPWAQKGTGRSRHGSSRSPIWSGGGVAHGPRNTRIWMQKINDKMKLGALGVVLSAKFKKSKVIPLAENLSSVEKTKDAVEMLTKLQSVPGCETLFTITNPNNVLLVVPDAAPQYKALHNIPCVSVVMADQLNALHIAKARHIVLADAEAVNLVLARRLAQISKKQA